MPDEYEIVRDNAVVGHVPGTVTAYTDKGLAFGSAHHYQVIAVRDGASSPASSPLTGQTRLPPLSDARLVSSGVVAFKMRSLEPADPNYDKQPGDAWPENWDLAPQCASGACDVTLHGTFDGGTLLDGDGQPAAGTASGAVTAASITGGLNSLKNDTLDGWSPPLTFTAGQDHKVDCWYTAKVVNGTPSMANGAKTSCLS